MEISADVVLSWFICSWCHRHDVLDQLFGGWDIEKRGTSIVVVALNVEVFAVKWAGEFKTFVAKDERRSLSIDGVYCFSCHKRGDLPEDGLVKIQQERQEFFLPVPPR